MAVDRNSLTLDQRWSLADFLAEENLPKVNRICVKTEPCTGIYVKYIKRLIDIILALFGLILTFPINMIIGIIIYFDVGRPIFFKQKRIGRNGIPFEIVKFRTMRDTRDERGELLPATQRVTKFGKFVRKTSLDELLNFWYVFRGDMSIIGPRPLLNEYMTRYSDRHKGRLAVRPGLECPPRQHDKPVRSWDDQFENDVWYVENISFKTDMLMCIRLIQFTFDRKNTEARSTVSGKGIFMGYNDKGKAINLDEIPQELIDCWYAKEMEKKRKKLNEH